MAATGKAASAALSSCRQAMSGCSRASQARRFGSRLLIPLTLNVAIFMRRLEPGGRAARPARDYRGGGRAGKCLLASTPLNGTRLGRAAWQRLTRVCAVLVVTLRDE